jgi:hypothetical protein
MNLDDVCEAMCTLVTGDAEECLPVHLFGNMSVKDARRLAVYRNNYRGGLADNLKKLFSVTSQVIQTRFGKKAWARFVDEVAKRGPLPNLRLGGAVLVDVLAGPAGVELGLPPWIAELANVEVTQRRVFLAPDVPAPTEVSVNPVMELIECQYDVMSVRSAEDPTTVVPDAIPTSIAIWRMADGERRTRILGPVEVEILRYVAKEGAVRPIEIAAACPPLTTVEDVRRNVTRLVKIELLTGIASEGPKTRAFDGRLCITTTKGTTP